MLLHRAVWCVQKAFESLLSMESKVNAMIISKALFIEGGVKAESGSLRCRVSRPEQILYMDDVMLRLLRAFVGPIGMLSAKVSKLYRQSNSPESNKYGICIIRIRSSPCMIMYINTGSSCCITILVAVRLVNHSRSGNSDQTYFQR